MQRGSLATTRGLSLPLSQRRVALCVEEKKYFKKMPKKTGVYLAINS